MAKYSYKIISGNDTVAIVQTETLTKDTIIKDVADFIAYLKIRWPKDKIRIVGLPKDMEKQARKLAAKQTSIR